MSQDMHPFAEYVANFGRGKTKQRHLTLERSCGKCFVTAIA